LNGYIAGLWADVRLCLCPKWVKRAALTIGRLLPVYPQLQTCRCTVLRRNSLGWCTNWKSSARNNRVPSRSIQLRRPQRMPRRRRLKVRPGEGHRIPEIAFRICRAFLGYCGCADFQISVVFEGRRGPLWITTSIWVAGPRHCGPVANHLALDCAFDLGRLVPAREKKRMLDGMRNSTRPQRRIVFLGLRENVTIDGLPLHFGERPCHTPALAGELGVGR
jgi:hypothetical protein